MNAVALRVLLVDDQELVRRGLALLLSTVPDLEVVGDAPDAQTALAALAQQRPDVLVTDARMPGTDGIALTALVRARHPDLPVLVLTTFDDEELVRAALAAGAGGFVLKDASTEVLAEAIRAVARGGMVLDPQVARAVVRPAPRAGAQVEVVGGRGAPRPGVLDQLTRAERAVAEHLARGATNAEIAAALVLAEGTVRNTVSVLLRKTGARDRTALALLLHRALGQ